MPFNVGKSLVIHRIDWTQSSVKWYVNGMVAVWINEHDLPIPDLPLHIKVSLVPDNMSLPLPSDGKADFRLQLFRVRYMQYDTIETSTSPRKDKTELYLKHHSTLSTGDVILISAIIMTIIALISYFLYGWKNGRDTTLYEPLGH